MKYVKSDIHSSLTQLNLSLLLRIKILSGEISVILIVSYLLVMSSFGAIEKKSIFIKKSKRLKSHLTRAPKKYDNSTFLQVIQKQTSNKDLI